MKFILGMLTGMVISTMFFIWYAKQNLISPNNTPTEEVVAAVTPSDDEFTTFYNRFHSDSIYQMSHITFPLEGVPRLDSLGQYPADFRWQEKAWRLHRPFNTEDNNFAQEFLTIGDGMRVENIRDANGLFSMQRRFAKIGDEWQLIYYAAMNQIRQEKDQEVETEE